jgi:hypothetical protein
MNSIPQGYEIYENPNGRVFLRKITPLKVTEEEVSMVENGVRQSMIGLTAKRAKRNLASPPAHAPTL